MPLTYSAEVSLRVYAPNTSGVYEGFDPRTPQEISQGLKPVVPVDSIKDVSLSLQPSVDDVDIYVNTPTVNVSLPVYAHDSTEVTSGNPSVITTNEFNDAVKEIQPAVDGYKTVTIDPYKTESKEFTLNVLPVIVVPFRFSVDTTEVFYDKYDWIDVRSSNVSVLEHDESRGDEFAAFNTHWQNGSRPNASAQVISSASNQYTLPTVWGGNYNFTVDWGDGSSNAITSWDQAEVTHTYATGGVYEISITGQFEGINFYRHVGSDGTGGTGHVDCRKLLNVYSWGTETILDLSSSVPLYRDPANSKYQETYTFYAPDASPPSNSENQATGLPFMGCVNWNSLAEAPPRFGYVPGTAVVRFSSQDFTGRYFSSSDTKGIFTGNNSLDCDLSNWGTTQLPLTGGMYGQFDDRAPKYGDLKANWVFEGSVGYEGWKQTNTTKENVLSITATVQEQPLNANGSNASGVIIGLNTADHIGLTDTIGNLPLGVYAKAAENAMFQNNSTNFDITNWDAGGSNRNCFRGLRGFDGDTSGFVDSDVTQIGGLFLNCSGFSGKGVETWDTSQIRDSNDSSNYGLGDLFSGCISFNKPLSHFVFGTVRKDEIGVSIASMLNNCESFNQDCSMWDTSYVRSTSALFSGCDVYDNAGVDWTDADFSKCTTFAAMFRECTNFNRDISRWKTPVLTSLYHTFRSARSFNKPINTHTVDGEKYWDVSNVTNMRETFRNAVEFNQPLDAWDVSNVTNFYNTFASARKFNQDLSTWDVRKGTNFEQILNNASNFNGDISTWRFREDVPIASKYMLGNTPLLYEGGKDLSGWNTSRFNSLVGFFYNSREARKDYWSVEDPSKLSYLFIGQYYYPDWSPNVGGWDTSNSESFSNTFFTCGTFNDDISGWNVSKSKSFNRFVKSCFLFDRNLSSWQFRNDGTSIEMQEMFHSCRSFNNGGDPGINNWNTSNVTNMQSMFVSCTSFNQPIGGWDVSNVTNMIKMFQSASNFNQDIGGWNVSSVTDMNGMFRNAQVFNQDLSSWNTSNVTDMKDMFHDGLAFNNGGSSGIDNWNTSSVTNMEAMFRDATVFNQPIGSWDLSSCTSIKDMFYSARRFNQPLNSWDTSKVTDMSYTFNGSGVKHDFNQPLSDWDTSEVTNMASMFFFCEDFNHPLTTNGNKWDVSKVTTLNIMFRNAQSFDQDLSSWNLNSATNIVNMFQSSGMSKANLDTTIQAWCANSNMASGLDLGSIPLNGTTETLDSATTTAMNNKGMTATYTSGNSVY